MEVDKDRAGNGVPTLGGTGSYMYKKSRLCNTAEPSKIQQNLISLKLALFYKQF